MSEQTLVADTITVLTFVRNKFPESSLILVGHSMGGAIACKVIDKLHIDYQGDELSKQVNGLFVVDVCEGSAMDALPFME